MSFRTSSGPGWASVPASTGAGAAGIDADGGRIGSAVSGSTSPSSGSRAAVAVAARAAAADATDEPWENAAAGADGLTPSAGVAAAGRAAAIPGATAGRLITGG